MLCSCTLNYRSIGSAIFVGRPSKPVPTSQKTCIFAGLLGPRSQSEYVGKHTGWSGSWKMDCFEDNSTVLSECEFLHFWHIYYPINMLCWLNQDSKNSGSQHGNVPKPQLWRAEGKCLSLTRLFIMSVSQRHWTK